MTTPRNILAFALALSLGTSAASADTVSASVAIPLTSPGIGGRQSLLLPSFDSTLGTLQSVTLTLNLLTSVTPAVYTAGTAGVGDVGIDTDSSTVTLTVPGGVTPTLTNTFTSTQTITSTTALGVTNGLTVTGSASPTASLTTGLAAFTTIGSSTLTFSLADSGNNILFSPTIINQPAGFFGGGGATSYSGTLDITYAYSVPEPSTWALMLGGVAFLFWRVRARRA